MSRRVFLLGVAIAMVALVFAATDAALVPAPGVTEANVRRIKPGMTLREVEAILGTRWALLCTTSTVLPENCLWDGPEGRVQVVFTFVGLAEGDWWNPRVARNGVYFRRTARPNLLDRLRSWLGW